MVFSISGRTTDEIANEGFGGDTHMALEYMKYGVKTITDKRGKKIRKILMTIDKFENNYLSLQQFNKFAQSGRPSKALQVMKQLLTEENQPLTPQQESRFFTRVRNTPQTGAAFDGIDNFVEFESDKVYIPSNYHCMFKCVAKMHNMTFEELKEKIPRTNPYGINNIIFNKIYKDLFDDEPPRLVKLIYTEKKDKFRLVRFSGHNKAKKSKYSILLLRINKKNEYHAILLKDENIDFITDLFDNIKIEPNFNITEGQFKYKVKTQPPETTIETYVWDIETATVENEEKQREQVPYMVGYSQVNAKEYNKALKNEETDIKKNIMTFTGTGCLLEMLYDLTKDKEATHTILMFAHNGGRFDNIFIKGTPYVKVLEELNAKGCIKQLVIEFRKRKIIFRDSMCFTLAGLNKSAENAGIKHQKIKFDIVNKSKEWFLKNQDKVREYLKQDIYLNGLVLQDFENKIVKNFNQSVNTTTGIPSIAWNLINLTCLGMKQQYIPDDPSTCKFIRASSFGGRVIHWKKSFKSKNEKDKLISLDANSLFPSAMAQGVYPVGKFTMIKDEADFNKIKAKGYLYIAELTLDGKNCKYPLIPYRTVKTEDEDEKIIYLSNKFEGPYNSVDIGEAESMGYTISNFKRGIYWKRCANIFEPFIKELYNERARLKKEGSGLEYIYKIILNSAYGKFSEYINTHKHFTKYPEEKMKKLNVKYTITPLKFHQYEINEVNDRAMERSPIHISSFILANARKIMNNYIKAIGYENVYYGDTDSIYCTFEAFKNSGIIESSQLGGIKNDYSENTFIFNAEFLDLKRYYLELKKGDKELFKVKFNSLKFEHDNLMANYLFMEGEQNTKEEISTFKKAIRESIEILTEQGNQTNQNAKPKLSELKELLKELEENRKEDLKGIKKDIKNVFDALIKVNKHNNIKLIYPDIKKLLDVEHRTKEDLKSLKNLMSEAIKILTEDIKNDNIKLVFEELKDNLKLPVPLINERWQRLKTSVYIEDTNIDITINPESRGKWLGDNKELFYPLDFDIDKEARIPSTYQTRFKVIPPLMFDVNKYTKKLTQSVPLIDDKGEALILDNKDDLYVQYLQGYKTGEEHTENNKILIYRDRKPPKKKTRTQLRAERERAKNNQEEEEEDDDTPEENKYDYYICNHLGPKHRITLIKNLILFKNVFDDKRDFMEVKIRLEDLKPIILTDIKGCYKLSEPESNRLLRECHDAIILCTNDEDERRSSTSSTRKSSTSSTRRNSTIEN